MTTSPVMTVTDELLAELEEAAKGATPGPWNYDGSYVCTMRQDGETVYVESWNPVADALLSKNVKYIADFSAVVYYCNAQLLEEWQDTAFTCNSDTG